MERAAIAAILFLEARYLDNSMSWSTIRRFWWLGWRSRWNLASTIVQREESMDNIDVALHISGG